VRGVRLVPLRLTPKLWGTLMPLAGWLMRSGQTLQRFLLLRINWSFFNPRGNDVYVATYPKSGTTLIQMMLYQLTTDGDMDFPHLNAVCPWIELELFKGNAAGLEALASPRCFKTHLLHRDLPRTGRYIYVVRDVRDVVVSAFHNARRLGRSTSLMGFAQEFLRSGWGASTTWFEHLRSWWPHRRDPNVLFLSYEGIIADLEGTVRRVGGFCGFPLREEEIPRILERCSLAFMKRHEEKLDNRFLDIRPDAEGFIRRGEATAGHELDPGHRELLEQKMSELAGELGCARGDPYRELLA
jgi:hypothetical protein